MRQLAPGSLVLFGSTVAGEFVLDTLMVVGGDRDCFVPDSAAIDCPQRVQDVVLEPLRRGDPPKGAWSLDLRLYEGASYGSSPAGSFSFVPRQPWEEESVGFPRPVIRLGSKWIKQSCLRHARSTPAPQQQLDDLWHEVVRQVTEIPGLALGVRMDWPGDGEASRPG